MKVFVGYGYNPRDAWVERLVLPLLRACGAEPVTGEETYGGPIPQAVRKAIDQCDAAIGFTTRRDPGPGGTWTTHRWVTDELSYAAGLHIPVLEVREEGVDSQAGAIGELQYVMYEEAKRDECLVRVARAVARWRDQLKSVLVQLKPQEFVDRLGPLVHDPRTRCTLAVMDEDMRSQEQQAQILPIKGGLFVRPTRLPRGALIQIKVEAGGKWWYSSYESVDTLSVFLNEG